MGRPRKSDKHLPKCVYEKHGAYYYVKAGKWTRLAADLPTAAFDQEKTGAKLLVRWTPELRDAIERANALNGNVLGQTLFRTRSHGKSTPSYGTTRDRWREAVEAAGVEDAHIHDLRAKSLTNAKRQGKDAQMLAGHTSPAMTDRYIRLREVPVVDGPTFSRQAKKSA